MARKNDTPQKAAMRELMNGYLKQNNVTQDMEKKILSMYAKGMTCSWMPSTSMYAAKDAL